MADATWDGFVSGDWDTVAGTGPMGAGTNWNPGQLPTGTATFPIVNQVFNTNIVFSAAITTIQNIQFTLGQLYTFTLSSNTLSVMGSGLSNAKGQIFNVGTNSDLEFHNSSTADQAIINLSGFNSVGRLTFFDTSTLGSGTVNSTGGVNFHNNSNAGSASGGSTITNTGFGIVHFFDTSSAGGVTIANTASVEFDGASLGGYATILNSSKTSNVDFSGHNAGSFYIGSISGPGSITFDSSGVQLHMSGNAASAGHSLAGGDLASGGDASSGAAAFSDNISGVISGAGGITMDAQGTLTLAAANTYTGDTVVTAGTIELAQGGSITGNFDFQVSGPSSTTVETLKLDGTNQIGGTINGYAQGDTIDLSFHTFATGDHAVWTENAANTAGTLSFLTGSGAVITTLNLTGSYTSSQFTLASDGSGGTVSGSTATFATTYQQEILGLYAALYNRAAEFPGYSFWFNTVIQQPDAAGVTLSSATSTALTLNDAQVLGQAFVNTQATFFNATYAGLTDSAFINALYVNIGGNAGDPGGIAYWAGLLAQAEGSNPTAAQITAARAGLAGQFVHDLVDVNLLTFPGLTPAQLLAAQQRQETINDKIAVSLAYSTASQQTGGTILDPQTINDAAYQAATTIIAGVTFNPTTVATAITGINTAVATQNLLLI